MCHSSEVLFAFDALVMPCPRCRRVMHQHCYVRRDGRCPRCARLEARTLSESDGGTEPELAVDAAGADEALGATGATSDRTRSAEESRGAVPRQRPQGEAPDGTGR